MRSYRRRWQIPDIATARFAAEVAEVLPMPIYICAGPLVMYAAQAWEAVDQMVAKPSKPA
jgi:hypothetical protein